MFFVSAADEILSNDFFSPLLAGALFPDFIHRFIPRPFEFLDRAQLPRVLGAIGVLSVFLACIIGPLSYLTRWSDQHRLPAVAVVLIVIDR